MSSEGGDIRVWRSPPRSRSMDSIGGVCQVIASDVVVAEPGRAGERAAPDGQGRQLDRTGRSARILIRTTMLGIVGRSLERVSLRDREQSSRFIVLATASVVVYSVALPLLRLYSIATDPSEKGRTVYAVRVGVLPAAAGLAGAVGGARRPGPGPGMGAGGDGGGDHRHAAGARGSLGGD